MKRKLHILPLLLVIVLLAVAFMKISPFFKTAIDLYKSATEEKTLESVVDDIRENENYVTLEELPETYLKDLVKSEDKRFYYHFGIDPIAIARAIYHDLLAGELVEGGSTITQQLAKNMYFTFEKKFERKVAEMLVAFDIERKYTKDEILELYCNMIYFGEDCYGIRAASLHYYGVEPKDLNEKQCEALIYTIKCPNEFNPNAVKDTSTARQNKKEVQFCTSFFLFLFN